MIYKCGILYLLFNIFISEAVENKIINGDEVQVENHPYIVSIRYNDKHVCGGAIISKQHVLTSTQCIFDLPNVNLISIRVGSAEHVSGKKIKIAGKPISPKDYKRDFHENDIAIIKLAEELEFNNNINLIELPSKDYKVKENSKAVFVGWGVVNENDRQVSDNLRKITPTILSYFDCTEKYGINMINLKTHICAESKEREFCRGDLGGPLVINNIVVGIASWIYDCDKSMYPGVYTNVAKFRTFIDSNMK